MLKPHPLSKPTDGIISKYINRHFSSIISSLLLKTNIHPNQITIVNGIISALLMLIFGFLGQVLLVGIMFQLSSILDGVDGEIARKKNISTEFGALLDSIVDYWINSIGIISLSVALLKKNMANEYLILFLAVLTISSYLMNRIVHNTINLPKIYKFRDSRDIINFLIFIGTILALYNHWYLIGILVFINMWSLVYMIVYILSIFTTYCKK